MTRKIEQLNSASMWCRAFTGWVARALALVVTAVMGLHGVSAIAGTGQNTVGVQLVRGIGIVKALDLDFGTLIASPVGGKVLVHPDTGVATASGGAILAGGTRTRGHFVIFGRNGGVAFITKPPGSIVLSGPGGTMQASLSLNNLPTSPAIDIRIFSSDGLLPIYVGGELTLGANQAPGVYTGTFNITVFYF